ncbi:poly(A) polymerase beta-like isoform X2 [Convolutriloba macropyga]|uniref:poly(A) polymerase beta-like isoform X2 n=1 Tax=Convolutriloba macropyga TaxID=536237 RepID=UPI003F52267C
MVTAARSPNFIPTNNNVTPLLTSTPLVLSGSSSNRKFNYALMGASDRNTAPAKVLGLTGFLCDKLPTPDEIFLTISLKKCLMNFDLYESDTEFQNRVHMLATLDSMAKEWIRDMAIQRNLPENLVDRVGGKLFTFGSYRLGVHTKGADIDTLLVAPRHVERDDFFNSFFDKLNSHPEVSSLRAVEDAFVPVIKLYFGTIEMDILFARLGMQTVTDETDLSNEEILKNLHISCVRSLNGTRVTDEILRLVPDRDAFRLTLHVIKLWARRKGIYSNVLGFLGGVSWAMLVARVCQLYPRAAPATLVEKFFLVFNCWKWPTPVLLQKPSANVHQINLPVWDPATVVNDRLHFMPIITPAFPEQNSTYNVSCSTLTIMKDFLAEGFKTVQEIKRAEVARSDEDKARVRQANGNVESFWSKLFEPFYIYNKYKHFIVLRAQSPTRADHLEWHGLVESKIRILVLNLEKKNFVSLAHVNPKAYTTEPTSNVPGHVNSFFSSRWFIGIAFDQNALTTTNVDLTFEIQNFSQTVHHTAFKNNMMKQGMTIEAQYVKKKDLPNFLPADELQNVRNARRRVDSANENHGGRKRKSESYEMENVEKKTKAMEVSDEEKERKLKQELLEVENRKSQLMTNSAQVAPASAPNANTANNNNTSAANQLTNGLHGQMNQKSEEAQDSLLEPPQNEDLQRPGPFCSTPNWDVKHEFANNNNREIKTEDNSPLNVNHNNFIKQEADVKHEDQPSAAKPEPALKTDPELVPVVLDDDEDDDVIELPPGPPPTLEQTPQEILTASNRVGAGGTQQTVMVSKRKHSQVDNSTSTSHQSSSNGSQINARATTELGKEHQIKSETKSPIELSALTPDQVDKRTHPSQTSMNIKLNLKAAADQS